MGGVGYDVTLRPSHSSSCDPLQSLDYAGYQFTLEHLALRPSSLSVENTTLARLLKPDVSICGSMPKITGQLFPNLLIAQRVSKEHVTPETEPSPVLTSTHPAAKSGGNEPNQVLRVLL